MIILQPNQYEKIKTFFFDIPGASWHLESMVNRNIGRVIVDAFPDTSAVYLETPFFFYYFAGKYQYAFMEDRIAHIVEDLIPAGETRPLFIFSSDQEWKTGIEDYLKPHINQTLGAYLTRRLLHLNHQKYTEAKKHFLLPDGYTIEMRREENALYSVALYGEEEVSRCSDGGRGLGYMDLDVFTHPDHRNKGLALLCCAHLIDHCLRNDLQPQWGCWTVNVPSCRLAEKLGFVVTAEIQANFAEMRHTAAN